MKSHPPPSKKKEEWLGNQGKMFQKSPEDELASSGRICVVDIVAMIQHINGRSQSVAVAFQMDAVVIVNGRPSNVIAIDGC
jgi:hypothetical protein